MVKVKFKFLYNISHYSNNIFAFHMHMFTIYILNFNLTLQFIPTSYSWLLHITRICISEYIVKNSKNKITIPFIII